MLIRSSPSFLGAQIKFLIISASKFISDFSNLSIKHHCIIIITIIRKFSRTKPVEYCYYFQWLSPCRNSSSNLHQNLTISSKCNCPLCNLKHHTPTNLQRNLCFPTSTGEKITLQLLGLRIRPRQPNVDGPQPRRPHRIPGRRQVLDRASPKTTTKSWILSCNLWY